MGNGNCPSKEEDSGAEGGRSLASSGGKSDASTSTATGLATVPCTAGAWRSSILTAVHAESVHVALCTEVPSGSRPLAAMWFDQYCKVDKGLTHIQIAGIKGMARTIRTKIFTLQII